MTVRKAQYHDIKIAKCSGHCRRGTDCRIRFLLVLAFLVIFLLQQQGRRQEFMDGRFVPINATRLVGIGWFTTSTSLCEHVAPGPGWQHPYMAWFEDLC